MSAPAVLNLGGGVQSTALLAMAAEGLIDPMPELAIFADPGAESAATYEHMEFLRRALGERVEIVTVTAGNLREDITRVASGEAKRLSNPPVFTAPSGMAVRACTRDYKIRPIERELRRRGFGKTRPVLQYLGISLDEVERMKPNPTPWITTRWPLIEQRMTRQDCLVWLAEHGYPRPPKSACTFCPYHSDAAWRDLRDNHPDEWDDALEVDRLIRVLPGLRGEGFLHRDRVPLAEADISSREDHGQTSLDVGGAVDECGGVCWS